MNFAIVPIYAPIADIGAPFNATTPIPCFCCYALVPFPSLADD